MKPFLVENWDEYNYCTIRGYFPLIDFVNFTMPIRFRVEVQNRLFGKYDIGVQKANLKFYRWVWDHFPHRCEETIRPLYNYSSVYVSHIISRGARADMAHDPRNINILCPYAHHKWEVGKRSEMRIYSKNIEVIKLLKSEYSEL